MEPLRTKGVESSQATHCCHCASLRIGACAGRQSPGWNGRAAEPAWCIGLAPVPLPPSRMLSAAERPVAKAAAEAVPAKAAAASPDSAAAVARGRCVQPPNLHLRARTCASSPSWRWCMPWQRSNTIRHSSRYWCRRSGRSPPHRWREYFARMSLGSADPMATGQARGWGCCYCPLRGHRRSLLTRSCR